MWLFKKIKQRLIPKASDLRALSDKGKKEQVMEDFWRALDSCLRSAEKGYFKMRTYRYYFSHLEDTLAIFKENGYTVILDENTSDVIISWESSAS